MPLIFPIGFYQKTTSVLWTFSELTTTVWYDSTSIVSSSGNLTTWQDKSGNARHLSPVATTPVITAGLNSLDTVSFDGSNYVATSSNFPLTGNPEFTTFIVYKKESSTNGCCFGWGNTITSLGTFGIYDDGSDPQYAYAGGNPYRINTIPNNDWNILCYVKSAGAINSASQSFINDISNASSGHSSNTPNIAANTLKLGRWADFGSNVLIGKIAKFVVVPTALDTDTRQKATGSLAWEFGLQSKLASDHPYKSAPPII